MNTSTPFIICKKCGGTAFYNFEKGCYTCATCLKARRQKAADKGPTVPVSIQSPPLDTPPVPTGPEVSLEELERRYQSSSDEGASEVALCLCQGCGATSEVPANSSIASCPFCDRKVVMKTGSSTVSLQEPVLVPFALDESLAVGKMMEHLSKLWLRPGNLKKKVLSGRHLRKVYLPFWAFDADIRVEWDASVTRWKEPGFFGQMFGAEGRYHTQSSSGQRSQRLVEWLVCASHGLEAELIELLEPFSTDHLSSEPVVAALGDTPLERGNMSPRAAWERAKLEIRRRQYRACLAEAQQQAGVKDDEGVTLRGRVDFAPPVGKAVILPLFIFSCHTLYGPVQIVVNGETGRVASKIPYSWLKVAPAGAAGGAAAALACVATMGGFAPVLLGCFAWSWYKRKKQREANEATFLSR